MSIVFLSWMVGDARKTRITMLSNIITVLYVAKKVTESDF